MDELDDNDDENRRLTRLLEAIIAEKLVINVDSTELDEEVSIPLLDPAHD